MLLPDQVVERAVRAGQLGCPVCGATFPVADGVAELDPVAPPAPGRSIPAAAMHAFLGLGGPGGYVVLAGDAAESWQELAELNPGVAIVAVNPPEKVGDAPPLLSVVRSSRMPLKARSMRGIVLGGGLGSDPAWIGDAARVVLPGRHIVGFGPDPARPDLEVLASAGGWWVTAKR